MMNYPFRDQDKKPCITQGTTPTITVTLPEEIDLTTAAHVYATVEQEKISIRKSDSAVTIEEHSVSFTLTQAESIELKPNADAKVQLNWTYVDGKRGCTKVVVFRVEENLEDEVLA